jgi:hypothetical protein
MTGGRPTFAVLAILLAAAATAANAGPGQPIVPAERLRYAVLRDGEPIGLDEVAVYRRGSRVSILSRAEVAFTVAGLTLFRLSSRSDEEWVEGRFASFAARTDYNGHPHDVLARPEGPGLAVTENGVRKLFPAVALVGTLLHPDTVRQSRLIDPINGKLRTVSIADRGIEPLRVDGHAVAAHHYAITGGWQRDVWYGSDGRMLRLELRAADGSLIRVTLP